MDFGQPNAEVGWKMANGQLLLIALDYCVVIQNAYIHYLKNTHVHTSNISLECRSLLILLMKKGIFGTQNPLSRTGETSVAA